jgi:propanol-preferring alcohol dehydrogenase
MKAAILAAPKPVSENPLQIVEVANPRLRAGHVLLRVRACGVCRTDLHIVEGELPSKQVRIIPGHQIVGEVVDGATAEIPLGSRVGVSWLG